MTENLEKIQDARSTRPKRPGEIDWRDAMSRRRGCRFHGAPHSRFRPWEQGRNAQASSRCCKTSVGAGPPILPIGSEAEASVNGIVRLFTRGRAAVSAVTAQVVI